jgi:predicted DCC family thiol-disulfide oxidoreductase YuxK
MMKETLYYDGACPLCAREMKHLAKLKRDSLNLVDIHQA